MYKYIYKYIYKMGDYNEKTRLEMFERWYEIGKENGFFDLYHLSLVPTPSKHENYNLPPPWQTQSIYVPPLPPPPPEMHSRSFYPEPPRQESRPLPFYPEPPRQESRPLPFYPEPPRQENQQIPFYPEPPRPMSFYPEPPRPELVPASRPELVPASRPEIQPQQQPRPPIYSESRHASQDYQRSEPVKDYQRPPSKIFIRRSSCITPDHKICVNWLKNKECSPTCQYDHTIYPLFKVKQCKFFLDNNCKYDDPVLCSHLHGDDPYDPEKRNYRKRGRFDE